MESGSESTSLKPLIGFDHATIDDKGRISVNKKRRERLGDNFVLSLGTNGCLVAYPEPIWIAKVEEMMRYNPLNHGRETYTRLISANTEDEINFDAQNRFVVPAHLRRLANLKDKVVLIGCIDRLEIWSESEWEEFKKYGDAYGKERRIAIESAYNSMVGA